MSLSTRTVLLAVLLAALTASVLAASCSSNDAAPLVSTPASAAPTVCASAPAPLQVDRIAAAIAAVESELGGPQQFFEINATAALVNLFVADTEEATATPFVFGAGELSAGDALEGASGSTFGGAAVQFDPLRVMSCVSAELPDSTPDVFEVVGGPGGAVQLSVLTSSTAGGQLLINLGPSGAILAVDPVDAPGSVAGSAAATTTDG